MGQLYTLEYRGSDRLSSGIDPISCFNVILVKHKLQCQADSCTIHDALRMFVQCDSYRMLDRCTFSLVSFLLHIQRASVCNASRMFIPLVVCFQADHYVEDVGIRFH